MEERRKYPRVTSKFSLDVQPADAGDATGQNVSTGGLMFSRSTPLEAGAIIQMTLRSAGLSGMIQVKGKVIRCDKSGSVYNVAVNFVDVDAETEASITEMLRSFF